MLTVLRRIFLPGSRSKPEVDPDRLPQHIAVIMDGNGRWAKRRGLPRIAGHRAGAKGVRAIVEQAAGLDIKFLTLYAFSAENWRRPKNEVSALMKLFEEILRSELEELHAKNVKIDVIGDLDNVAQGTQRQFQEAIMRTAENTGLNLIIALNYGGRTDILRAANYMAAQAAKTGRFDRVDELEFSGALSTAGIPDPELIIRTSGEMRISNFLLWEGAYAEFWVTDTLWPDFSSTDLLAALADFQSRDRRFGGLTQEAPSAR